LVWVCSQEIGKRIDKNQIILIAVVSFEHFLDDERIYHRQIKTLIKNGFQVSYFTRSNSEIDLSTPELSHVNFPKLTSLKEYTQKIVGYFSGSSPPKVVHIHEPELLDLASTLKIQFGTKVIYDVHEDYPSLIHTFSRKTKLIKTVKEKFWLEKEKRFLKWVDRIILASPYIKNSGYDEKGFTPVILENFPTLSMIPKVDFDCNRGNTMIYHGHLGPERGISELIQSVLIVSNEIPDISLSLYGSFRTNDYQNEILALIKQLSLDQHINWYGQINHEEIWEKLSESSVGVIPFLDKPLTRLGTPTKLFEYMASGCRIVASNLPPMKRFDVNGILMVSPGNIKNLSQCLVEALQKNSNESLELNHKKIMDEYNWETIEHRLIDTYGELLK
jgi:glycosyltransferase involved in cell wall biosynthesis